MEHSRGPWRVGASNSEVVADTADVTDGYGGELICESVAPRNVALICAAPDLLAAVKLARSYSQPPPVVAALVDAIAKAQLPQDALKNHMLRDIGSWLFGPMRSGLSIQDVILAFTNGQLSMDDIDKELANARRRFARLFEMCVPKQLPPAAPEPIAAPDENIF